MSLNVLDLFAGCGGLSEGLKSAGHTIVAAVELDKWAGDTFASNHPRVPLLRQDITAIRPRFWTREFRGMIDLIAGGPPCQGFSLSGKRQYGTILDKNLLVIEFLS